MTDMIYEASVYTRKVKYTNFKGETREMELQFALDPLELMSIIATFQPKKSKSKNPAKAGQDEPITDEEQVRMVRDLCEKSAGVISDDGESFDHYEPGDFSSSLAGKAFLTKLAASDADRKEFSEKVVLSPFEAFVGYAEADPTNSAAEVQQMRMMLEQLKRIFAAPSPQDESYEERRARLQREIEAMGPAPTSNE